MNYEFHDCIDLLEELDRDELIEAATRAIKILASYSEAIDELCTQKQIKKIVDRAEALQQCKRQQSL